MPYGNQLVEISQEITQPSISPRVSHSLARSPSSSHKKSFRLSRRDWKLLKNYRFLVNFAPCDSLNIPLLATVKFTSIRSWQIWEILTFLPPDSLVCFDSAMLTHRGRDKMAAISQTTVSNAYPWMKMFEFRLKFHCRLFLRVQLTIS